MTTTFSGNITVRLSANFSVCPSHTLKCMRKILSLILAESGMITEVLGESYVKFLLCLTSICGHFIFLSSSYSCPQIGRRITLVTSAPYILKWGKTSRLPVASSIHLAHVISGFVGSSEEQFMLFSQASLLCPSFHICLGLEGIVLSLFISWIGYFSTSYSASQVGDTIPILRCCNGKLIANIDCENGLLLRGENKSSFLLYFQSFEIDLNPK